MVCTTLNYIGHFLTLASTGCISISAFASLVGFSMRIMVEISIKTLCINYSN